MGRIWGGISAASTLVLTAVLGVAAPAPAASVEHLDATLAPTQTSAGDQGAVTSVDGCSGDHDELIWAVFHAGDFSWDAGREWSADAVLLGGHVSPADDGSWQVTFAAPGDDVFDPGLPAVGSEPDDTLRAYGPLPFSVGDKDYDFVARCLDQPVRLRYRLSPSAATAGETITATSVDPCPPESEGAHWKLITSRGGELVPIDEGDAPVADDGSWAVRFTTPAPGTYTLDVACTGTDATYQWDVFEVQAPDTPTPPAAPPPATPIDEPPPLTG